MILKKNTHKKLRSSSPLKIMNKNVLTFFYFEGTTQLRYNKTDYYATQIDSSITVTYEDGHWSKPYFDCGGGDIWMMTYTVPFFGYKNGTFKFK